MARHSSISCLAILCAILLSGLLQVVARSDYPGVIELVGYSNRRARTHYMPATSGGRQLDGSNPTISPPPAKTQADIETVKQNIEKYNKLLTLDTRNLPESQKDMLERIVERVARLKESLDIEDHANAAAAAKAAADSSQNTHHSASAESSVLLSSAGGTTEATSALQEESETDPTLVLDETTLLQLQTSMDELAAAQAEVTAQTTLMRDVPTTTELNLQQTDSAEDTTEVFSGDGTGASAEFPSTTMDPLLTDSTDPDDQFVAARSNNNIAAITAADSDTASSSTLSTTVGSQRTITTNGKLSKPRATKRPGSASTKANGGLTSKRGQRPVGHHKQNNLKQKLASAAAGTTTLPLQYQKQKPQQLPPNGYQQQQQQPPSGYQQQLPSNGYQQQQQQKLPTVTAAVAPSSSYGSTPSSPSLSSTPSATAAAAAAAASAYGSNANTANDMVYDAHVNTSAIIDSLNHAREEFYQQKVTVNNKDKKPSATAKPTKYHYYPHNQHIYLLPECAIQQVCNAVYVRLNYTQPLCACPSRYRDPCSASLNEDDQHTTKLVGDGKKKAITLAKTCEATTEMRECRSPKDWSLLALQNTRTGKSHYLVICRCPDHFKMEGPMAHDQPTYASVPGIRVFGMMCVKPGYSVGKPSVQPPKRYQLQKPFYRPQGSQSSYISNNQQYNTKDNYGRPVSSNVYGGGSVGGSGNVGGAGGLSSSSSNYHSADDLYQNQHQANYQYLNRPESTHSSLSVSGNYRPDTSAVNNFQGGIYGRNNERKGEAPIEAAKENDDDKMLVVSTSTQSTEETPRTTAASNENVSSSSSSTDSVLTDATAAAAQQSEEELNKREKRSIAVNIADFEDDTPEFPWDRVLEFQQSIVWE